MAEFPQWRKDRCEWCRNGLPMSACSGYHFVPNPSEIFQDIAGERFPCTAPIAEEYIAELREALKPFAAYNDAREEAIVRTTDDNYALLCAAPKKGHVVTLTEGHLRRARAALSPKENVAV